MRQSRRRQFLIASSALLAAPLARAQPPRRVRVGCLWASNEVVMRPYRAALLSGLRERGYIPERNLILDERHAEGNASRYGALAEELIALKPDVLVGIEGPAVALKSKTQTIPIVLIASSNPVASGLVKSLARPGTNVTGISYRFGELIAKQFELLLEIAPKITRAAFFNAVVRPDDPAESIIARLEQAAHASASAKNLALVTVSASDVPSAHKAFDRLQRERVQGLVVAATGQTLLIRDEIIAGARRLRIPSVSGLPAEFAERGGLVTYSPNYVENYRYAAKYVDLILKGAKPADLPVEQLDRIEFVVNLRTARELGVTIPQMVLFRADRVIE